MEMKKAQKHGMITKLKKANLSVTHTWWYETEYSSCIRLVFFCVISFLSYQSICLVFVLFHLHPYMQKFFFYKKLFTLVSFIFVCLRQTPSQWMAARQTVTKRDSLTKMLQCTVTTFALTSSQGRWPNVVNCCNIVKQMTQADSLKARTQKWKLPFRLTARLVVQWRHSPEVRVQNVVQESGRNACLEMYM